MFDLVNKAIIKENEFLQDWNANVKEARELIPSLNGWTLVDCDISQELPHTYIFQGVVGLTLVQCECLNADFDPMTISEVIDCNNFLIYSEVSKSTLDKVIMMLKVGDQINGLKDGMPICWIDEKEWGIPIEQILGENNYRVFCPVQIDRRMLPKLIDSMQAVGFKTEKGVMGEDIPDPNTFLARKMIMPLADLALAVGMTDLEAKARSATDKLPLINGLMLSEEIFKPSVVTGIEDINAIANGTYTVGASKNYATWSLFGADVTTLSGALTGRQETPTIETAVTTINQALAGYTLTLTSDTPLLGNYNNGHLVTASFAASTTGFLTLTCSSASAGAKINVNNLKIIYTGTVSSNFFFGVGVASATANITNTINDCIVNGNAKPVVGYRINNAACVAKIFNCIAANGTRTASTWAVGGIVSASSTDSVIENCSFYNMTGGLSTSQGALGIINFPNIAMTFKNNACFGNSKDYTYGTNPTANSGLGNGVASSCASTDTTGSAAALRSLTAATEWDSLDLANASFAKTAAGATQLKDQGVAPSITANTYGVRGNARPHDTTLYSIGADEYPSVVVPPVTSGSSKDTFKNYPTYVRRTGTFKNRR